MAETYTSRTLRELLRIVASRFLGMAILFVIIVGAVVAASLYAPKWYRSEVQLLATPTRMGNPLAEEPTSQREQVSLFVKTQREIVRSDTVLAAAMMMLHHLNFAPKAPTDGSESYVFPKEMIEGLPDYMLEHSEELRRFKKRVSVETPGGPDATFTQTFTILVDWPEARDGEAPRPERQAQAAEECYLLANYIVWAYKARYRELEEERTQAAKTFLQDKALAEAAKAVRIAQNALETAAGELGPELLPVASIIGNQGIDSGTAALVTELERNINDADMRLAELRTLKAALDRQLAQKDPSRIAVPDEVTRGNAVVSLLQQKIIDLKLKLNNLTPQYTNQYGEVDITRKELAESYQDLIRELEKQRERTITSIAMKTAEKTNLEGRLAVFQARMTRLGPRAVKYDRLQQALQAAVENYNEEERHYFEAVRAENFAKTPMLVSVVDGAGHPNPDDPRRPILWLNILIGCVGGLVLALVYAFLADHFDHTMKSVDDAERYLGTTVIASVPKLGRRIIQTR